MDEKEKDLPAQSSDVDGDAATGDMEDIAPSESDVPVKSVRTPMSPRTKKRIITAAIVTGALLLVLATVLIVVAIINNRPPKLDDVRERFERLIIDSQEINEIIWGAGLPVYSRVDAYSQVFEQIVTDASGNPVLDKNGKPYTAKLRYYLYDDETYGKIVSYEYQWRVAEDKTTEVEVNGVMQTVPVYTVYDVENGGVLSEFKNGAKRFAHKTKEVITGKEPIFEENGFYYYALPHYENEALAASSILYSGDEDSHYDYVIPNQTYRNTDDVKAAMDAVYTNAFMAPLYEYLFTGMIGAANDVNLAAYSDYIEEGVEREWLMKSNDSGSWQWRDPLPVVEFDFSSMQMIKGNAKSVTVSLDYRLAGEESVKQMEISFAMENGQWLLNSPTFG